MKRFMQDLGDLTGLDIVAAMRHGAVLDTACSDPSAQGTAAPAAGMLRWAGLAAAARDGRCRRDDRRRGAFAPHSL